MFLNESQILKLAKNIEMHCEEMHADYFPNRWNANFGQWLVYGFERTIGFNNSVNLCAEIERAFKAKKPIEKTAVNFFWRINK